MTSNVRITLHKYTRKHRDATRPTGRHTQPYHQLTRYSVVYRHAGTKRRGVHTKSGRWGTLQEGPEAGTKEVPHQSRRHSHPRHRTWHRGVHSFCCCRWTHCSHTPLFKLFVLLRKMVWQILPSLNQYLTCYRFILMVSISIRMCHV